ncbi:acyl-CoA thioesterase [Paracoccus spongiarum]|uniref:Acyl-CoA thioesterase n=1 Tax=Paracoccus spongiarum TaxID=3064387 RepID=A0ABT9JFF1_9RHOB|nr:acyl-CoA thioesterase [Paracoccus sp. 2205BS29-5]MDP5308516.1 acyl-CoA thioesterase [Paracoccus sp. 2205BS29-5]
MYPLFRFAKEMVKVRGAPALAPGQAHVSTHLCWPWDLDPWIELNNGRTLTLFDLGRIPMVARSGLVPVLRRQGWGLTVAGNTTRYRRRIRMFDRFTMISQIIGWDDRFLYIEQSMWKGAECCNHMLLRAAITSSAGIVPPARLAEAAGRDPASPPLPDWVLGWIAADATRPWPPEVPAAAKAHLPA